ncbi:MAG: hypothetical protein M3390_10920 [Chloroflexota bacterium]|nr:hypothetical protein [Chloroflexota bacterium]
MSEKDPFEQNEDEDLEEDETRGLWIAGHDTTLPTQPEFEEPEADAPVGPDSRPQSDLKGIDAGGDGGS